MSPLPYSLEDAETNNLFIELDRRLANLEGKVGEGLSHNDLIDIEDHKTFLKQDGSVPVIGNLDFSKSGQIKNTKNKILNVDIFNGNVKVNESNNQLEVDVSVITAGTDHGLLVGLGDDDHTQYALLLGRSGGQTLRGGTNSGDDLTLQSTSHATKGSILFGTSAYDEVNNRLGIGTLNPRSSLEVNGDGNIIVGNSLANETNKGGALSVGHYTNAEEPAIIFGAAATATANLLLFGGGSAALNAATQISFYTASNNTTTTGTERIRITDNTFTLNLDMEFDDAEFLVFDKASGNGIKVDTTTPTFGFADLLGEVFQRNTGASKPTRAVWKGGTFGFQFAAGKNEEFEFHIPHDYVLGTEIFLHIHWGHNKTTVTGGTVTFDYELTYSKGHGQGVFGTNAISTIVSATATTAQYSHELSEGQVSVSGGSGTQIDTDGLEPDGVIKATVGVNANNLTVSSGGVPDPFIHYVDIHYQSTGLIGTKGKAPDFYV